MALIADQNNSICDTVNGPQVLDCLCWQLIKATELMLIVDQSDWNDADNGSK